MWVVVEGAEQLFVRDTIVTERLQPINDRLALRVIDDVVHEVSVNGDFHRAFHDLDAAGDFCVAPSTRVRSGRERRRQILHQTGSDWPQIAHIRDFFRSDFSTFWLTETKCTEI